MLREDEAGWSNPKILTIFFLVFLCGLAFGAAGTRAFLHQRVQSKVSAPNLDYLTRELQLTSQQKQVVMEVLDDYAKYYENLEQDRENVAEHGKDQIMKVLRPDQQKRFAKLFQSPSLPGGRGPN